ncbi:PREDICTED: zinc finger BED domain-containing protein 6 isoform X2 [Papilio polytes]|uniref:zinc finger BED domain-containing protein 6 isoform X2 n=1 Tax=Papilio polytes TaxID=76194 RepID=UPI000675E32C|nr:PREDICTED: zinc finger BED domain-containing protein 6 isoform X2 [Papilio polytes]
MINRQITKMIGWQKKSLIFQNRRSYRSKAWNHFDDIGDKKARCKYCQIVMSYRTSITNLTKHVNRAHFKNVLPSEVDSSDVETTVVTVEESENDNSHVEEEQKSGRKFSKAWCHFDDLGNYKAQCKYCKIVMSYKGTITNLKTHFIRAHLDELSVCDPVDSSDLETTVVTKEEAENDNADSYPVKRKRKRYKKSSKIWNHFDDRFNGRARCKYCELDFSYSTLTNLSKHIERKHLQIPIELPSRTKSHATSTSEAADEEMACTEDTETSVVKNPLEKLLASRAKPHVSMCYTRRNTSPQVVKNTRTFYEHREHVENKNDIDRHIMNLFIYDMQHFSIVEDRGFRELIAFGFPNYTLPTRQFFANNMLPTLYEKTKSEIKESLNLEVVSIYVSTDMWTSKYGDCFLALTGCYIDSNMILRSLLLELCQPIGSSHTELAAELTRIVKEWKIKDKIFVAMSDNDSTMKFAIEKCLGWQHLTCYALSLNLLIDNALNNDAIANIIQKTKALVKKSTIADLMLEEHLDQILKANNKTDEELTTRWDSIFEMSKQLIELKEVLQNDLSELNVTILSENDWDFIEKLVSLLNPCDEVIKEISGYKDVPISIVIPVTFALKSALVEFVLSSEPLPDAIEMIRQHIFDGLVCQLSVLEENRIYTTSMFLDPRYKLYFEKEKIADSTKEYVTRLITSLIADEEEELMAENTSNNSIENDSSIWSHYNKKMSNTRTSASASSKAELEIQNYLDDKIPSRHSSPLEWWKDNQSTYPRLAMLARVHLNVLATRMPCENYITACNDLYDRDLDTQKIQQLLFLQLNCKNESM